MSEPQCSFLGCPEMAVVTISIKPVGRNGHEVDVETCVAHAIETAQEAMSAVLLVDGFREPKNRKERDTIALVRRFAP